MNTSIGSPRSDPVRELLRHTLATVAYRGGKALRDVPNGFAEFQAGEGVRTPGQILAHLGDLFDFLASSEVLHAPVEKLFQGPVADALTHVGQIGILRRLAKAPVKGESYYVADIETGRVGADQTKPKREF